MAAFIEEWASPDFHKTMYLPLALLLIATFAVLALSTRRSRPGPIFLLLVTTFGALRSVRHIPIFSLIAIPIFAEHLWGLISSRGWDKLLTGPEQPASGFKLLINVVLLLSPVALGVSRVWHFALHQQTYEAIRNPVAAVDFLKTENVPGPLYNNYGWGGYLIYRLYPEYRVYIDGRADVYGDRFFAETMNIFDGLKNWREPLDSYGVRTVLISPDAPMTTVLRREETWKKIYEDKSAVIFTRDTHVTEQQRLPETSR